VKIVCEKCGADHALEPPDWVVSSGRAFRFRCASCGHTQMVPPPTNIQLTGTPTPSPRSDPAATTAEPPQGRAPYGSDSLYLKQEGKVYLVKDWDTLKRWIRESRVGMEDLISTGGVRWEPVGSRAELALLVAPEEPDKTPINPEPPPIAMPTPFPFGGETPFSTASAPASPLAGGVSGTGEVDGIPVGLPPLPAIDVAHSGATASEASTAPGDAAAKGRPERASRSLLDAPTPTPAPARPSDADADDDADLPGEEDHDLDSDEEFLAFDTAGDLEEPYDDWRGAASHSRTPLIVAAVATVVIVVALLAYALWPPRSAPRSDEPQLGSVLTVEESAEVPASTEEAEAEAEALASAPEEEVLPSSEDTEAVEASAEPETTLPEPEPEPRVSPPEPVATVTVPPPTTSPTPPPTAAPEPEPPPSPPTTPAQLVDEGWMKVDRGDLTGAAEAFRQALEITPLDAVANFGYGYVLANQDLPQEARPFLCRALEQVGTDIQTEREIHAILSEKGLTCE